MNRNPTPLSDHPDARTMLVVGQNCVYLAHYHKCCFFKTLFLVEKLIVMINLKHDVINNLEPDFGDLLTDEVFGQILDLGLR